METKSELEQLFNKAKKELYYDDENCFKFSFAFALHKVCSECHSGQWSELYALLSALSIEWDFSMGMASFDYDDDEQVSCFDWLIDEFDLKELYTLKIKLSYEQSEFLNIVLDDFIDESDMDKLEEINIAKAIMQKIREAK